jgi:hypothetical protein
MVQGSRLFHVLPDLVHVLSWRERWFGPAVLGFG